jgi:hypothetical protein
VKWEVYSVTDSNEQGHSTARLLLSGGGMRAIGTGLHDRKSVWNLVGKISCKMFSQKMGGWR